ncbi:MAG: VirB8 protein [Burkholderiales bacterium]|jgi:type IV secretory pathway TrbF-like protein|nr:VirB8 protein [Burkholderiales bacterium]
MKKNPKISSGNVYLKHIEQNGWNDMHMYHIENQAVWRNLAILTIFALVIVSVWAMYIVNGDKHRAVIFEKDSQGNLITLGLATETLRVDNKVVAHQLINFITSLREVPQDINVKRRNIDLVHKMIEASLRKQIDQMIIDQYSKNKIIMIIVKSIRPMQGGNSWQIVWEEKYLDNNSNNLENTLSFSSVVTFKRLNTDSLDIQLINPIGLFITYINPTQDIGG